MVYNFFDKKASGSGIKNENISNKELGEEIHKPIVRKFNKRKVQSPFISKIFFGGEGRLGWGAWSSRYAIGKYDKN